MKFKQFVVIVGLTILFSCPGVSIAGSNATQSCACNDVANAPVPQIAVIFQDYNGSIDTYAQPNPLLIFFRVKESATSTQNSKSYTHFAQLITHTGMALSDLQGATSGMSLSSGNYIVLDQTSIPLLATGSFAINHDALPGVAAWVEQLTVVQAALLDNEFVILAFDKNGRGVPTTFAKVSTWKETADHLSISFMSQVYQE